MPKVPGGHPPIRASGAGGRSRLPPSAVIVAGPVGHWGDNSKHSHVVSFPQLDPKQTSGEIFPALPNLHRTGPRSESTSPTPRPPIPRSCAAWPTAPPRRVHCPLPWTQSRIAATDKVDQAIRIGRFVDAALDLVLRLQLPALGGDKAKNHLLLVFRQDAQRLEAAGAIGVELEES